MDLMDEDVDNLMDVNPEVLGEDELKEHAATVSRKFVEQNQEALAAKNEQRIKPKTYQEYNKWDAFDVDDQLKAFDEQERKENLEAKKSVQMEQRKREQALKRKKKSKKEQAVDLKEEGNEAFKKGDYQEALDCYTL